MKGTRLTQVWGVTWTLLALGCARQPPSPIWIEVEPATLAAEGRVSTQEPPQAEAQESQKPAVQIGLNAASESPTPSPLRISILSPHPKEQVAQIGEVRFRIRGTLSPGHQPVLYIRDATGLESNWWSYIPRRAFGSRDEWICGVQFGEPRDRGKTLAILVLILPADAVPSQGTVGFLPSADMVAASSEMVKVIRK